MAVGSQGVLRFNSAIIRYEITQQSDYTIIMTLFSDYWIINKASEALMSHFRSITIRRITENKYTERNFFLVESHPMVFSPNPAPSTPFVPLPFSLTSRRAQDGKRSGVFIKLLGCNWSPEFSLDTVSLDGSVEVVVWKKGHA